MNRGVPATTRRLAALAAIALGCAALTAGCNGGAPSATSDEGQLRAALRLLGMEYGKFLVERNAPPKDEAELRAYLESRMIDLSDYGVKGVDDLIRNGRDGQPIRVIYGAKVAMPDKPEYAWAAYEQNGAGGTRLAVDSRGGVHEVGEAEFSQRVPVK